MLIIPFKFNILVISYISPRFEAKPLVMKRLIFFTGLLGIVGCQERSPLSDVEVNDPELITPQIRINRTVGARNEDHTTFIAFLNDDNGNSIELSKGKVQVNEQTCGVRTEGWGRNPAPFYSIDRLQLTRNNLYTVNITLADGSVYPSTIQTPNALLEDFTIPDYHNFNHPFTIYCDAILDDPETKYALQIKKGENIRTIHFNASDFSSGHMDFTASELQTWTNGERANLNITLVAETKGKIHPKFNGGDIVLTQSVTRQITMDDSDTPTDVPEDGDYVEPEEMHHPPMKYMHHHPEEDNNLFTQWSTLILLLFVGGVVGYGISRMGKN